MPCPTLALLVAALCSATNPAPGATYIGRENQLQVRIPRVEGELAAATIDGTLNEPVWRQATLLTGFSQFSPLDGIPAADSTQVLIWYSPTALYVGIRAFEAHGAVHATLADRDKITRRRQRAAAARHVPRSASGVRVRGESVRRADGRHDRRDRAPANERRMDADADRDARRPISARTLSSRPRAG